MQKINLEYFQTQLDTLYEDSADMEDCIIKQFMYNKDYDIYITKDDELDEDDELECEEKLNITTPSGIDMYMYQIKVDRDELVEK